MEVTYLCPYCRGAINAGNNIILSAKTVRSVSKEVLLENDARILKEQLASIEKQLSDLNKKAG